MTEIGAPNRELLEAERRGLINLACATVKLLSDFPPKPVDAIFFHGRSYFDAGKRDLFQMAVDMINDGKSKYIVMLDSEGQQVGSTIPKVSYPGKTLWTDRLVGMGVGIEKILYSPPLGDNTGFNTKTEGNSFMELSKEKGFKTAVILAQPHQIVRAMLGYVRSMIDQFDQHFDLWCAHPQSTDWQKKVKGSQGMELKPRSKHIEDEIKRIFAYQAKGDLASFSELFQYLDKRDSKAK